MKKFLTISLSILFSTLLGTTQAAGGIRNAVVEEELMPKLARALEGKDFSGELSFEELGIQDEREAQGICGYVLNLVNALPDYLTCSCNIQIFQLRIVFGCAAEVCLSDIGVANLNNTCLVPSYNGILRLNGALTSTICNEKIDISFDDLGLPVELTLPKICAVAEHVPRRFSRLRACKFSVGDYACPCSVCGSSQSVNVDCTGASVLGPLAQFANFTCLGLDLIGGRGGGGSREQEIGPFINPILSLPALLPQP
jgi:hypothetical protein